MANDNTPFDFNNVMNTYYTEIFHYLRKQTNNTEDAKDLTQDVFMKVFNKKHTYNPKKASIRTWLYRIAHHHVVNFFKKAENKKRIDLDDDFLDALSSSDDQLEALIQHDNVNVILQTMRKHLNKKHYRIMNLYFFSELSVDTIAKTLNIPIKTVYNTINVSIKKIQKLLEVHNDG